MRAARACTKIARARERKSERARKKERKKGKKQQRGGILRQKPKVSKILELWNERKSLAA